MMFKKVAIGMGVLALAGMQSAQALIPMGLGSDEVLFGTSLGAEPNLAGATIATASTAFVGIGGTEVKFTGTLHQRVVRATHSGKLDFYFQIVNNAGSADSIHRMTNTSFRGFTTAVEYRTDIIGGTVAPKWATRSTDGSVMGWDFDREPFGNGLMAPGKTSLWMVIRTNAASYTTGSTQLINGGVGTVASFAPVPEPATMALAGLALAAAARRRARKNA